MRLRPLSLLWKILLSTSLFITLLLALTGWFVQDHVLRAASEGLQAEIQGSFRAYESLWQARAETLRQVSLALSNMSDVRAAFGTNDTATIRDTAEEIWRKISRTEGIFLVTDPAGSVIASLGGGGSLGSKIPAVLAAARSFPSQASGFVLQNGRLYQLVVTPVYVDTARGPGLLDVLVAGHLVDDSVAAELKHRTGSSDFVFVADHQARATTLDAQTSKRISSLPVAEAGFNRIGLEARQYAYISSILHDLEGRPVGEIVILRSFDAVRERLALLERELVLTWIAAVLLGFGGSYLLARRLLDPVKQLDRAAAGIARQEYRTRVPVGGDDELGRLASTFNTMCQSIQEAREELIRQERISTIGRLSSSIVHDLRNPLAAIYGGAEMLMDSELNESQVKRLAANIYRSSRSVKDLLQELVDVSRQPVHVAEQCRLREVIGAAVDLHAAQADSQSVDVGIDVADGIELPMDRARMERVFRNLIGNALEAMPNGGSIAISAARDDGQVRVKVEDTGPGIPQEVRPFLFQPFATSGKKNGLGLGLALSRQTVLDHGGDLWADEGNSHGARFWVKLPG